MSSDKKKSGGWLGKILLLIFIVGLIGGGVYVLFIWVRTQTQTMNIDSRGFGIYGFKGNWDTVDVSVNSPNTLYSWLMYESDADAALGQQTAEGKMAALNQTNIGDDPVEKAVFNFKIPSDATSRTSFKLVMYNPATAGTGSTTATMKFVGHLLKL
ncbi:MAG: hypothetical protein QW728_00940 [Thermoplasmata archaeon]